VTLSSLVLASVSVIGTNDVVATITLTGPAPAGGVEVELTSSNQAVSAVPPVLTIPAGTTSATLIVTTSLVTADTQVTITAMHATTTKTATLSVLHPSGNYVSSVNITPPFIAGGTGASGTVTLAFPSSDHGGSDVVLASSNAALSVPASVKVNPNATTSAFTIATSAVTVPVPVTVTASYGGVIQRMNVIVAPENAVTMASLTIAPTRVTGGTPAMATVTLNRPAPSGGARVTVEARRRNIVTVPDAVVVPEGSSVASFSIATDPLHAAREKSVEIVATYNNNSASATLTVLPTAQATSSRKPDAFCASLVLVPCVTQSTVRAIKPLGGQDDGPPPQSAPTVFEQQYTFYTPELNLMSETTSTSTTATPVTAFDYVWFGGQPLAQIENATGNIAWYFNDHLGTPIRQTDETGRVLWHAEYEPYGTVYAIRRGEGRHQPLRFPGQMSEEGSDLYQNVFRFYRAGWGRYTQADPISFGRAHQPYTYVEGRPGIATDPRGLYAVYDRTQTYGIPERQAFKNACVTRIQDKMKGRFPAGACNFVNASATCGCSCNGERYSIDPISVFLIGPIYYFSGDWSQMPRANDTSVISAQTAIEHEWRVHILPSLAALDPIISAVEGSSYSSKQECAGSCALLTQKVSEVYHKAIVATQAAEERKYP